MQLTTMDRRQARILDDIGRDLHFLSPTEKQRYAARLIDSLSRLFTAMDIDSEQLGTHPRPDLFDQTMHHGSN